MKMTPRVAKQTACEGRSSDMHCTELILIILLASREEQVATWVKQGEKGGVPFSEVSPNPCKTKIPPEPPHHHPAWQVPTFTLNSTPATVLTHPSPRSPQSSKHRERRILCCDLICKSLKQHLTSERRTVLKPAVKWLIIVKISFQQINWQFSMDKNWLAQGQPHF